MSHLHLFTLVQYSHRVNFPKPERGGGGEESVQLLCTSTIHQKKENLTHKPFKGAVRRQQTKESMISWQHKRQHWQMGWRVLMIWGHHRGITKPSWEGVVWAAWDEDKQVLPHSYWDDADAVIDDNDDAQGAWVPPPSLSRQHNTVPWHWKHLMCTMVSWMNGWMDGWLVG